MVYFRCGGRMTNTNYKEFQKLFNRIPKERLKYVNFITLRSGSKIPLERWKEEKNHLNPYQIKKHMGFGGNIAIVGRLNGLMFLDVDVMNVNVKELATIDTFTVRTRSGGLHYYFLNDGDYDNQYFVADGKELGELRTNWQYVVACGSWVEPEQYKVICDKPLSRFEGDITKYFKKGIRPKEDIQKLHGIRGVPISDKIKKEMEDNRNDNDDRRKQILEKLKQYKRI